MLDRVRTDWKTVAVLTIGLLAAFVAGLVTFLVALPHLPPWGAGAAGFGCFLVLLISVLVVAWWWRPRLASSARLWKYLAWTAFAAFTTATALRPAREWLLQAAVSLLQRLGVPLPSIPIAEDQLPYFLILCGTLLLLALFYTFLYRPPITPPSTQELPEAQEKVDEQGFPVALARYCGALTDYLNQYDREVNWSDRDYAPLEAEVQTESAGRLKARIVPGLVDAVRRDRKSTAFIIIGDPGSGKSVSLRNLVRKMAEDARRSGVVPVYANLREFPAGKQVTVEALVAFAQESVREQTGRDGEAFVYGWYDRFRQSGRLFFVFDSFDELPQVLDADDRSEAHRTVCVAFDRLFTQELRSCRAALASRPFRAPSGVQGTRLNIRPLSESKVRQLVASRVLGQGFDATDFVRRVFRDRPELIPLLRNPFTAELLTDYARTHGGGIAPSMYDIFNAYFTSRLEADATRLSDKFNVTADDVREAARILALSLFESNGGLEVDVVVAVAALDNILNGKGSTLVEALKYSRLARVGGRGKRVFTFSHRRFAEFFAVDAMRQQNKLPPLDQIPTDSRWRDGLVMYVGVASEPERQRVAEFCWSRLEPQADALAAGRVAESGEGIHCLRFLTDAFRGNLTAMHSFQEPLAAHILKLLDSSDLLVAKIAAEAIPLAGEDSRERALLVAMRSNSGWIVETAISSCRNLRNLTDESVYALRRFVHKMHFLPKLRRFGELHFSFSLSESFHPVRRTLWADVCEVGVSVLTMLFTVSYIALTDYERAWISFAMGILMWWGLEFLRWIVFQNEPRFLRQEPRRGLVYNSMAAFRNFTVALAVTDPVRVLLFCFCFSCIFGVGINLRDTYRWEELAITVPIAAWFLFLGIGRWPILAACKPQAWLRMFVAIKSGWKAISVAIVGLWIYFYFFLKIIDIIVNLSPILPVIFGAAGGLSIVVMCGQQIIKMARDARVLARGIPLVIEFELVIKTLAELRTSSAKRKYLTRLLAQRVQLTKRGVDIDAVQQTREALGTDAGVSENWAKLREFWLGLAR